MEQNLDSGSQIAHYLLQIKAVVLSPDKPFTWASGWKSPIYCDNRLILSYPEIRDFVRDAFVQKINAMYPDVEVIAGVATGGIALAALIAQELNLPMVYVRSDKKAHGRQNQVEGKILPGQKCVVIEDLISTGGSSQKAVDALRDADAEVVGLLAIFNYGFDLAAENFSASHTAFDSLCSYPLMLQVAEKIGYLKSEAVHALSQWRENPAAWNPGNV